MLNKTFVLRVFDVDVARHLPQALLTAILASTTVGCSTPTSFDTWMRDPSIIDGQNPPGLVEITIESGGAKMNGLIYLAQGAGSHATVVFLHGFPGNERNLDLAQAARRAGFNALFFNYRGSWGSGGNYSFAHMVEDTKSAVRYLRSEESVKLYHGDPSHVVLVGHSMGGWVALMAAASDPTIGCAGYLAGFNLGRVGQAMRDSETLKVGVTSYFNTVSDPQSGPLRGTNGQELVAQLIADPKAVDVVEQVPALRNRALLLVSGGKDNVAPTARHHDPLLAALKNANAERITSVVFENGDHSFSAYRIALANVVVGWLKSDCSR